MRHVKRSPGPMIVMMLGWTIMLLSAASFVFLDWRYLTAGVIFGAGEFFAGLCWWSRIPEVE